MRWKSSSYSFVATLVPLVIASPARISILRFLQTFVYVPVDTKHCGSFGVPPSLTKQSNFEDVPFNKPERAARTWLAQKALKGKKVATPSLNWITLSSTFAHGVSVLASGQIPYVGYATPLAFRRAGPLVATTCHFFEDMMGHMQA